MLEHIHNVARLRSGHKGFKAIAPDAYPGPLEHSVWLRDHLIH